MPKRLALAGTLLAWLVALPPEPTYARPQYLKQFGRKYKHIEFAANEHKCTVCHCGAKKTGLNNYGAALKDEFAPAQNVKLPAQIDGGLSRNESKPSHIPGKTFGQLIAEGQLPGGPCPPPAPPARSRD
jgi:hypothetical protein